MPLYNMRPILPPGAGVQDQIAYKQQNLMGDRIRPNGGFTQVYPFGNSSGGSFPNTNPIHNDIYQRMAQINGASVGTGGINPIYGMINKDFSNIREVQPGKTDPFYGNLNNNVGFTLGQQVRPGQTDPFYGNLNGTHQATMGFQMPQGNPDRFYGNLNGTHQAVIGFQMPQGNPDKFYGNINGTHQAVMNFQIPRPQFPDPLQTAAANDTAKVLAYQQMLPTTFDTIAFPQREFGGPGSMADIPNFAGPGGLPRPPLYAQGYGGYYGGGGGYYGGGYYGGGFNMMSNKMGGMDYLAAGIIGGKALLNHFSFG